MNMLNKPVLTWMCLLLSASALAASPSASKSEASRYARRCQSHAPNRSIQPQGTLLWGTRADWREVSKKTDEGRSVLVSLELAAPSKGSLAIEGLRLEKAHLVVPPQAANRLVGAVLQGRSSEGEPVEVAVCGAEPAPEDRDMVWYRIEAWNPVAQEWENPCAATSRVPDPRALAVGGVWDASGARQDVPGKITLACENGVISKCIAWGYKPWASHDGQSLASMHQACTRMARADYCGNGRSHTHQDTTIDMYDRLGVLAPTLQASAQWDPSRAGFEAAWAPDGATCLARTRDGRALETVLQECPGRFRQSAAELGEGDRCTVERTDTSPKSALLRNRSYGLPPGAVPQTRTP